MRSSCTSPRQPDFSATQRCAFLSNGTLQSPNRAPDQGFPFTGHTTRQRGLPHWRSRQHRGFPFHCLRTLSLSQTNDMILHMGSLAQLGRCSPSMAEVAGSTSRIRHTPATRQDHKSTTNLTIHSHRKNPLAQEEFTRTGRIHSHRKNSLAQEASKGHQKRGPPRPLIRRARSQRSCPPLVSQT